MAPIYAQMPEFAYTPDKTPIYGIFHPFVFNNRGKQHGESQSRGNFGNSPDTGFPHKPFPFLAEKRIFKILYAPPHI
jgi:hypothetical protein